MQNSQADRFDRLRELAEKITSRHPDQGNDFQGYDIPALINELQVYQAELEIQNDELRAAQPDSSLSNPANACPGSSTWPRSDMLFLMPLE